MNAKAKPPVAKAAETVEMGSGNVFADLGLPDADERHLRVQLAPGSMTCSRLKG
jgi:hypothetical protein